MIGWLIVACEISFWIFVIAGLVTRYILHMKKLSGLLLVSTPLIDLILIMTTVIDLKNGSNATLMHGLAAYYLGMTIAFGKRMITWGDQRFAYRFANGPKPAKNMKYGSEHAKEQREGWYRHLMGWVIGNVLLLAMILFVNDAERTKELENISKLWGFVLSIDFLISFSYTFLPKKRQNSKMEKIEVKS